MRSFILCCDSKTLILLSSVVVPMIIVVSLAAMIVAMTAMLGMIAMPGMTGTAREMIATGMIAVTAGNGPGRLLAALKLKIVAPGLHLLGGNMRKEGLQGTMIGEVAIMTGEALTLTMTAAGTTWTDAGTTAAATRGKIVTRTGRGMPTGITVGRAEFGHGFPDNIRLRCGPEMVSEKAFWIAFLPLCVE